MCLLLLLSQDAIGMSDVLCVAAHSDNGSTIKGTQTFSYPVTRLPILWGLHLDVNHPNLPGFNLSRGRLQNMLA